MKDPTRIGVDFEAEQLNGLRELAETRGTSVAALIRLAVEQYLKRSAKG